MSDYCTACGALKEYAPNFVKNGITDKECKSLQKDTGFNPGLKELHKNCEDLNDMLDCLLNSLQDKLPAYSVCDWKAYMKELTNNLYTIQKAMICSECGQWIKVHEIEDSINKLWAKMAKVEAALDALAAQKWEVDVRRLVQSEVPELKIHIDRSGYFEFNWTDWDMNGSVITNPMGRGKLTGTINFGMAQENGMNAKWQVRSVTLDTVTYQSLKVRSLEFIIKFYVPTISGGTLEYERAHDSLETFTDKINKTIPINLKGVLDSGQNSGWLQIFTFKDQGKVLSSIVDGQVRFSNKNLTSVPPYI
ncbi:hypothetical protein UAW_01893 [Enterococcus haemoperoxidus ATCC BAA-382]|uniref:Adhesin BspA variable domain-containing protein n=1 Tax=Enterococcus haemoperoxidus ATCC BAA-382 TaxID=1158608 RepID=R2QNE0_9ENTE|nr:hypothetical protein [Enterococcus haemoperoxidus]EOH96728.1 hypothetical protein UAW_01893 [Enterococcus haemoperoxidus ATCC BAA-382]EOT60224.1 hypothetical protein I583_02859 [Enterococcus haemoperoxidus ATCC BAA-382]OJG52654.1 hypothetical protein RV06_GL000962 [Enterococcus haemoperoxidus]